MDFFGYNTPTQSNQIISADNAVIDLGNGRLGLVQQFSGSYGHQVETRFEIGSSTLYFVNGKPQGQFQVSKLVGREGILTEFRTGQDACGGLRQISVSLDGGACDIEVGPGLNFNGVKLRGVSFQGTSGGFEITESADFLVAQMG